MRQLLVIFFLCLLFAGSHQFRPSPPLVQVPKQVAVQIQQSEKGFQEKMESQADFWLRTHLPEPLYRVVDTAVYPVLHPLEKAKEWGLDPKTIRFENAQVQSTVDFVVTALDDYLVVVGFLGIGAFFAKRFIFRLWRFIF